MSLRDRSRIRRRLKPGAPFVATHFSIPDGDDERPIWLSRYSAFLAASGVEPDKAAAARTAIDGRLSILAPEQDEVILRQAGFTDTTLFYTGYATDKALLAFDVARRRDAVHDVVEERPGVRARHRSLDTLQPLANLHHDCCVFLGQCMRRDRHLVHPFDGQKI